MRYRPDAILDLIDAMTIVGQVSSPVAISESPLFRRKFSSVYDVMLEGEIEVEQLRDLLVACQPAESETIAGYEVYAVDATPNERMAAETLPDRGALKAQQNEPVRAGAADTIGYFLGSTHGRAADQNQEYRYEVGGGASAGFGRPESPPQSDYCRQPLP